MEDDRVDITRDGGDFELTLNGVFVNDTANYTCSFNNTRIPQVVMATILLEVNEEGTCPHSFMSNKHFPAGCVTRLSA